MRLARESKQSIPALAANPGISSEALRHWLRQDDADGGRGQPGGLTADERDELRRPRREVNVPQQEREILRKAAGGSEADRSLSGHLEGDRLLFGHAPRAQRGGDRSSAGHACQMMCGSALRAVLSPILTER